MRKIVGIVLLVHFSIVVSVPVLAGPFVRQFPIQKQTTLPPGQYTFTFLLFTTPTWGTPVSRSDHTHAGMGTISSVTAGDGLSGGGSADRRKG